MDPRRGFKVPRSCSRHPIRPRESDVPSQRRQQMSEEIEERRDLELDSRDEIQRINARMDRQRAAKLKEKKAAAGGNPGG